MSETVERRQFLQDAATLDRLVADAAPELVSHGISWHDGSNRTGERDGWARWSFTFEREWSDDLSTCLVRVWATLMEATALSENPVVSFNRRAEKFRGSQASHVDLKAESKIALEMLKSAGLFVTLADNFRIGASAVGKTFPENFAHGD